MFLWAFRCVTIGALIWRRIVMQELIAKIEEINAAVNNVVWGLSLMHISEPTRP